MLSAWFPKDLYHMWDGTSGCSFNQWFSAIFREPAFSDSHGKCSEHEILLDLTKPVKEGVVASDRVAIPLPPLPGLSPIVVWSSRNCLLTGSCCSKGISNLVVRPGCSSDAIEKVRWKWDFKSYFLPLRSIKPIKKKLVCQSPALSLSSVSVQSKGHTLFNINTNIWSLSPPSCQPTIRTMTINLSNFS